MKFWQTPHPLETSLRAALLRGETVFVSMAMVLMVGSLILQVVARFLFEAAITWTDETAIYAFIWTALIGGAIVIETRSAHLIDYFVKKFPDIIQRLIRALVFVLLLGTCWVLVKYGYDIAKAVHNQRSSVLNLRISYVYISLPIAALLMGISLMLDWRYYLAPRPGPESGI